ncbi:MAG: BACON domain-containing protein [Candidatus Cryptobacteroides sp.]
MKFQQSFLVASVVALAFAACEQSPGQSGDEDKQDETSVVELINYGDEEIAVPAAGGDFFFSFVSSDDWTATSSEDWIFVNLDCGQAGSYDVDFSVEENDSGDARSAIITVSVDDEHSFTILISQEQNNVISVDNKTLIIGSDGGQLAFKVTGNIEYKVFPLDSWITVVSTKAVVDNTVTVEVAPNEGAARHSAVRVKSNEGDVLVKVEQEAGITDYLYAIEATCFGDYYGMGNVNWVLSVYNNDFINGGEAPKIYDFVIFLPAEYDFFKLEAEGLPEGVFAFNDSFDAFTFNFASGIEDYVSGDYVYLADGEIVIKDGIFSFNITDVNGNAHKAKWKIYPSLFYVYDESYGSTVTADYEVTFDKCTITPIGQAALQFGVDTYQTFLNMEGGHPQLGANDVADDTIGSIMLSSATEDFTGTFVVEPANKQSFSAGTVDGFNSSIFSYYNTYYVSDGVFIPAGGTVTVTKEGEEYVVEGVLTDDYPYGEPHKLTIHSRGTIEVDEETTSSASSKKAVMHKTLSERRTLSAPRMAHNDYRITL